MPKQLTLTQATTQARRHVDKLMPGAMTFVNSRLSHDLATDIPLVVTTISFPPETTDGQIDRLVAHLSALPGYQERFTIQGFARVVISRAR